MEGKFDNEFEDVESPYKMFEYMDNHFDKVYMYGGPDWFKDLFKNDRIVKKSKPNWNIENTLETKIEEIKK